jgi:hypothetical protein
MSYPSTDYCSKYVFAAPSDGVSEMILPSEPLLYRALHIPLDLRPGFHSCISRRLLSGLVNDCFEVDEGLSV